RRFSNDDEDPFAFQAQPSGADKPRVDPLLLTSPLDGADASCAAVQLATAPPGDVTSGKIPFWLIVIAPSPAAATSTSTSSLANPFELPRVAPVVVDFMNSRGGGVAEIAVSDADFVHWDVVSTVYAAPVTFVSPSPSE